jgi:hypothetical protein
MERQNEWQPNADTSSQRSLCRKKCDYRRNEQLGQEPSYPQMSFIILVRRGSTSSIRSISNISSSGHDVWIAEHWPLHGCDHPI